MSRPVSGPARDTRQQLEQAARCGRMWFGSTYSDTDFREIASLVRKST